MEMEISCGFNSSPLPPLLPLCRTWLRIWTWISLVLSLGLGIPLEEAGPRFTQELPPTYTFSNLKGGKLTCKLDGEPKPWVEWVISKDLSPVDNITSIREVDSEGSLVFKPFEWQSYRPEIHSISYRCRASNAAGRIISTEVRTRPVVDLPFQVETSEVVVLRGNIATLRCLVPEELKDFVSVTSWVQDGTVNIYPNFQTGKYLLLPSGDLYVFHVDASDGFKTFACRASSKLNNQVKTSRSVRIIPRETEKVEGVQLSVPKELTVRASAGEDVYLPCAAQGNPPPNYTWLRDSDGILGDLSLQSRKRSGGSSSQIGPLLLSQVRPEDSGVYVCRANNSISHVDLRVTLEVYVPLRVQLSPGSLTVDVGRTASFRCLVSGSPLRDISWFKDGVPIDGANHRYRIFPHDSLTIGHVEAGDVGMYQCFACNSLHCAQDGAGLGLGSVLPELTYRFAEQTLQPGPSVSLKCTAVGNPPPQFTWTLDGFSLPENERFLVGQYVTIHDNVISHVNITNAKPLDGGRYACRASNAMGSILHTARLNIYGPPFIRAIPPVKATAGRNLVISCPVSGYPIESIGWERGGSSLPVSRQQKVFPNGTLIIENIQRGTDEGIYTCHAKNRPGLSSSRDLHIQVVVPPKIMPFQFLNEYLQEGRRLAVSCQILEGDKPIEFTWLYAGTPISSSVSSGVSVRIPDEYSSTLVIDSLASSHNGEYACMAENSAGKELHTATLTVNVPPKWTLEPRDINVAAGQLVTLQCQADGHPKPIITWKRASSNTPGEYKELVGTSTFMYPNGTIRFESIKKSDEGQYLCEAGNGVGSGLSKVLLVKVNAPAELIDRDEEISVKAGDRAILQCKARGDLPIDVQWLHKHAKINPHSTNRYSTRSHETGESVLAELIISGAGRSDSGVYNCRASNTFGSDQTSVRLKIQEAPEQPGNLRLIEEQSRSIQISWSEGFNGNSPLINFIIQYKFPSETWTEAEVEELAVPATQTTAILPGLSPSTTYHLRVLAQNGMGFSRPSDIIQVTTAEEAPEGSPTDVHILPVTSQRLRVAWSAPEKHLWHGNILGYYLGYREIGLALLSSGAAAGSFGSNSVANNDDSSAGSRLAHGSTTNTDANGYHFKTVEVGVNFGGMATIDNLKKYTTYAVVVQGFNSKGTGPLSHPVLGTTEQDVPSLPPEKVSCVGTSASSLKVTVEDPPLESRNGVIQGYKVMHQVSEEATSSSSSSDPNEAPTFTVNFSQEEDGEFPVEIKLSTARTTTIHGLRTFTNYSVSALAFTTVGDGVLSPPILCQTQEDVPTAPADIKALVSSRRSILLSWLPPSEAKGRIGKFTIYIRPQESEQTETRVVEATERHFEVIGLKEALVYEFWLTASTRVGEGSPSNRLQISPSNKVPARIASFGQTFRVPWKRDVLLRCDSVGTPEPTTVWTFNGKDYVDSSFTNAEQAKMGSRIDVVKLGQISPEQAGNYTCRVSNPHGNDWISYDVQVLLPPKQPNVSVLEAFYDSLRLSWSVADNGGSRIRGYVMNYKRGAGDWEEYKLAAPSSPAQTAESPSNHLLSGLICGSGYQLFMTAFNKIGTSKPSEILRAKTKGEIVPVPRKEDVLVVNSTSLSIRLDGWRSSNCPVLRFRVHFKPHGGSKWRVAATDLSGDTGSFTLESLEASRKYDVQVEATNHAGASVADFTVSTTASILDEKLDGRLEELPHDEQSSGGAGESSTSLLIVLPLILSFIAISGVIAVLCYFRRRHTWSSEGPKTVIGEPAGGLQVIMEGTRRDSHEDRYCVFKGVSGDPSVIYQEPLRYKSDSEYGDDVCPYATFQLPDQTPGRPLLTKGLAEAHESARIAAAAVAIGTGGPHGTLGKRFGRHTGDTLYSEGNIYSGPYHSVQAGGMFYEQATLPLREAEYGRRHHHAHRHFKELEGAESDNVGSTDSEVKKILTLHMPISEYDDTLGSDSEGEKRVGCEGSASPIHQPSKLPKGAKGAGGLQEMLIFRQRQRSDPAMTSDHSSASSDSSQSSGARKKSYFSRKNKSKSSVQSGSSSMKQRVRSSSGYSSHTEETSFSFCDRLQPPTRFSDSRDDGSDEDVAHEGAVSNGNDSQPRNMNSVKGPRRGRSSMSRRRNPTYHIDV